MWLEEHLWGPPIQTNIKNYNLIIVIINAKKVAYECLVFIENVFQCFSFPEGSFKLFFAHSFPFFSISGPVRYKRKD